MNREIPLADNELLMGRMAALIEFPYDQSKDYLERYMRVTDMSLNQDTIKNMNQLTPEHRKSSTPPNFCGANGKKKKASV